MMAVCFSETSVLKRATLRCHVPELNILQVFEMLILLRLQSELGICGSLHPLSPYICIAQFLMTSAKGQPYFRMLHGQ
jgi:hypothetical protein